MGLRSSRLIITVEDAQDRLGPDGTALYTAAFRRLCNTHLGLQPMRRAVFQQQVLALLPNMPILLASALFNGFDSDGTGEVNLGQFLAGVAILRHGTPDELVEFQYYCLCLDPEYRHLTASALLKVSRALHPGRTRNFHDRLVDDVFNVSEAASNERVTLPEFRVWARSKYAPLLLSWFDVVVKHAFHPDPAMDALHRTLDPTSRTKALAQATAFTEDEVTRLQTAHSRAKMDGDSGVVDLAAFSKAVGRLLPPQLIERLVDRFEAPGTGVVDPRRMTEGLAICCLGSQDEQARFCFSLFDANNDGQLQAEELRRMLLVVTLAGDMDAQDFAGLGTELHVEKNEARMKQAKSKVAQLLKAVYQELGKQPGEEVTFHDYERWATTNVTAMNFLHLIQQVTRVELGARPASAEGEANVIKACFREFSPKRPGAVGDVWHILPYAWWQAWVRWSGFDRAANAPVVMDDGEHQEPGQIDLSSLTKTPYSSHLRLRLHVNHDFKLVPPRVGIALRQWYGCKQFRPLTRKVVGRPDDGTGKGKSAATASGRALNSAELELYPPALLIHRLNKDGGLLKNPREVTYSKVDTLLHVRDTCAEVVRVEPSKARLWLQGPEERDWVPVRDLQRTLEDAQVVDGHAVLLELQLSDGSWPCAGHSADDTGSATTGGSSAPRPPGLVGLYNLGNTCYMNSALQCLAHTRPLTEYFVNDEHVYDVNTTSRMGYGGEIAVLYGELVKSMWSASAGAVAPRRLKQIIGKWNEQFAGLDQQDSQELLAFLLNGLNEDLNRVSTKPYADQPDSDGRPDDEVAEEWWLNTLTRERSIVLLFTGQFKSLLTCANCGFESARFEPFTTLQLPLPEPDYRFINVTVVFRDNVRLPVVVSAKVPKTGCIGDLKRAVALLRPGMFVTDTPQPSLVLLEAEMVVCRVSMYSITTLDIADEVELKTVPDRDPLYIFQTHAMPPQEPMPRITKGTRVDCKFRGKGDYYPGRVKRVRTVMVTPTPAASAEPAAVDGNDTRAAAATNESTRRAGHLRPGRSMSRGSDSAATPGVAPAAGATGADDGAAGAAPEAGGDASGAEDGPQDGVQLGEEAPAPRMVEVYDVVYDDGDMDNGMPRSALEPRTGPARVTLSHRCLLRARTYFLRPFAQSLFNKPMCLRVLPSATSGRAVYGMVWRHSKRYIRKSGRVEPSSVVRRRAGGRRSGPGGDDQPKRDASGADDAVTTASSVDAAAAAASSTNGDAEAAPAPAAGAGGDAGAGAGAGAGSDDSSSSDSDASSMTSSASAASKSDREAEIQAEYGFVLRHVSASGMYCSRCAWSKACRGCVIDPDTLKVDLDDGEHVAIDWDPVLIDEAFDRTQAIATDVHSSVASNQRLLEQPLTLGQCLHVFTKDEKLEAFCSKCSRVGDDIVMRQQTKKMDLWRVPPILVIQLKRFQFTEYSRRKLTNLVTFPVRGLDLSHFMGREKTLQPPPDLRHWEFLGGLRAERAAPTDAAAGAGAGVGAGAGAGAAAGRGESKGDSSGDADKPPAGSREANVDGVPLMISRDNVVYDLYAVVNHFGMLGAGHYVAYALNHGDNKWHCYNDRGVTDLDESGVQGSSAYLLFYQRRDIVDAPLSRLFPRRAGAVPVDISKIGRPGWKERCSVM